MIFEVSKSLKLV